MKTIYTAPNGLRVLGGEVTEEEEAEFYSSQTPKAVLYGRRQVPPEQTPPQEPQPEEE